MKAPWSGQLSAAKTGWLVMLLFFGWLSYLLVPAPKPEPPLPPAPVKLPPSRLVALGLPDNPDLEHLPEYFALYADQAEWKDDKTIFAYWNPGAQRFEYFFEATRRDGIYYFATTSKPDADEVKNESSKKFYWDQNLTKEAMIRFLRTNRSVDSASAHSENISYSPTIYDRGLPDSDLVNQPRLSPPPVPVDLATKKE